MPEVRREIAGMSLEALRDHYRHNLFEDYLPFWEAHGIDHEVGGFMCAMDHDGAYVNTDKAMWYLGRGLWVYSFLHNHFGGDHYLEVARKARDFTVRHGRDEKGDWVAALDRQGRVVRGADGVGYAGSFVAEGLQEYYRATGDRASLDLALESFWRTMEIFDDSRRDVPQTYIPRSYPGMRTQGFEMVTIRVGTQILEQVRDPKLEGRVARAVDAVMNRYWNPEYRLNNEALTHDYERPEDENEDFIYLGHAIETLWMVMAEAVRVKDRGLFDLAAERMGRHIEVAWDDVYDGLFRAMRVHGAYTFDKVLWLQEEALIGLMMLMEHTGLEWPARWFDRIFHYVQERFCLRKYGYPLWIEAGDRKVTFRPHSARKENYHHPRYLMLNLLAVERMIERGGAVSALWR